MARDLHTIVGLGATGFSCLKYLSAQNIPLAITDTRENPPYLAEVKNNYPQVITRFGRLDDDLLQRADRIILSPGIALNEPVIKKQVDQGKPVIGDIELFAEAVKVPVIAITGTNAKSTVTTLVGKMAEEAGVQVAVGGNLGIPALDLLLQNKAAELFILELSSFQLETTSTLKPRVASILNITPDHMDRYDSFAAYTAAKQRIYQHCQIAVCNRDDLLTECHHEYLQRKLYFTLNPPHYTDFGLQKKNRETYLSYAEENLLAVHKMPVVGKHYQANALASLAIGYGYGLPLAPMLSVLKTFRGLPHRCQLIRKFEQVNWVNDSKGTNVGASNAAIEGIGSQIKGKLIVILGGVGKNADFSPMLPVLEKFAREVVLIGEAKEIFAKLLKNKVKINLADNMEEAVNIARLKAEVGDCVLLSPACASFDMFNHYAHRGDVFTTLVQNLK